MVEVKRFRKTKERQKFVRILAAARKP